MPEVRRYLQDKGLPFKVLLIFDNALGYPHAHRFNTEGVEVIFLPPDAMSLL